MDHPSNPFARGYDGFEIRRVAVISYDHRHPNTFLPLHASQAHLTDDEVAHRACVFNEDFVLVTEGQTVSDELDALCGGSGMVLTLLYGVYGKSFDGNFHHVGDSYTQESAQDVVRNLQFETGFYSRAWEISTAHIDQQASDYLMNLADIATPTSFLFIAFRVPYSPAIGVKLIATPWTDANLQYVEEISAEQLKQEHRDKGMPESLVNVLHLAALADVRILILDADAPVLEGLPLFDDQA